MSRYEDFRFAPQSDEKEGRKEVAQYGEDDGGTVGREEGREGGDILFSIVDVRSHSIVSFLLIVLCAGTKGDMSCQSHNPPSTIGAEACTGSLEVERGMEGGHVKSYSINTCEVCSV